MIRRKMSPMDSHRQKGFSRMVRSVRCILSPSTPKRGQIGIELSDD
jgi:hypothetical protein